MDKPKVSVVIPVYNCQQHIGEALDSVLAQIHEPYEVIAVDDGSTDKTPQILQKYVKRVKRLAQQHSGVPTARNTGIRHATGEIIAFLDSDDIWLPDKLTLQIQYLTEHPMCSIVHTDISFLCDAKVVQQRVNRWLKFSTLSGNIFSALFLKHFFTTSTLLLRRDCFIKVGLFDETLLSGEDYDMGLRLARHFDFGYVDEPLTLYRQHAAMLTRTTSRPMGDHVPWEIKVLNKILKLYPDILSELGPRTVRHRLSEPYFSWAQVFLKERNNVTARALMRQALKYWPTNVHYCALYLASCLPSIPVSNLL